MMFRFLARQPRRSIQSLKERRQEYQIRKQQEQFSKMIEDLAEKERYTLKDYKKELDEQLRSSRSGLQKLFSGTEPEEAEQLLYRKILNAMREEELQEPTLIDFECRKEIAQVVQCDLEKVKQVLSHFKNNVKLQAYLKARKERGEYLPTTQDELMNMLYVDRPPKSRDQAFAKIPRMNKKEMKKIAYRKIG